MIVSRFLLPEIVHHTNKPHRPETTGFVVTVLRPSLFVLIDYKRRDGALKTLIHFWNRYPIIQ
jgi:hypothetical protein